MPTYRLRCDTETRSAYTRPMLSYAHGVGDAALLGDTIGEALRRTGDYAAMVAEVRPRLSELRSVFCIDDDWAALGESGRTIALEALAAREASLQSDDPINIQYTSGTTGFPKGATLTHHNILNNGFFIGETLRYTERDRVCIPVPFYHCFGMVLGNLACTTHGSTMVIPAEAYEPQAVK